MNNKKVLTILAAAVVALASICSAQSDTAPKAWTEAFVKPPAAELRKRLTPIQYHVTQESGTERAFANEYWNDHRPGIYVDVVSGEPLFSSLDKYDSGTGWPSFTKAIAPGTVKPDGAVQGGLFGVEVRSAHANSHLGHVFNDGPAPKFMRYCINSAALRFVPAERLEAEGYGQYAPPFAKTTRSK